MREAEILHPEKYSIAELEYFKKLVQQEIIKKRALERKNAQKVVDEFSAELGDLENSIDTSTF